MQNHERRKYPRYVIGGLMLNINGVPHETLDVSSCAVSVIKQQGFSYAKLIVPAKFFSDRHERLNMEVTSLQFVAQRSALVVLGYEVSCKDWESRLKEFDVRSDMQQLEDVFG